MNGARTWRQEQDAARRYARHTLYIRWAAIAFVVAFWVFIYKAVF